MYLSILDYMNEFYGLKNCLKIKRYQKLHRNLSSFETPKLEVHIAKKGFQKLAYCSLANISFQRNK